MKKNISLVLVFILLISSVSTAVATEPRNQGFEVAQINNVPAEYPARTSVRESTGVRSGDKMIFSEYFEEMPSDWTIIDANQDGETWGYYSFAEPYNYEGISCIGSSSFVNYQAVMPDNYAITPEINLPYDVEKITLSWWELGLDAEYCYEHYQVLIGTQPDPLEMTAVLYEGDTTCFWTNKTVDLSGYAGQTVYLAFRHCDVADMYRLMIDCIEIYADVDSPENAVEYVYVPVNKIEVGETYLIGVVNYYHDLITLMSNKFGILETLSLMGATARTAIFSDREVIFAAPIHTEWKACAATDGFHFQSAENDLWLAPISAFGAHWLGVQEDTPQVRWKLTSEGKLKLGLSDLGNNNCLSYGTILPGNNPAFDFFSGNENEGYFPIQLYLKTDAGNVEPLPTQYKVTFTDWDDSVIEEQLVDEGKDAVPPAEPKRDYWLFNKWEGGYTNVTADVTVKASYCMLGDANMDSGVNTGDAALILQYCVDPSLLNTYQVKLADLNRDTKSNTGDAALILQISVGLENKPW